MWVEVTSVRDGIYIGTLVNEPQHIDTLAPGSEVEFGPHQVAAYDWDAGELGYEASRHAWVSKEVLGGTQQPRLVTLRPPESISEESDSGWTIGNGDEPNAAPDAFEWSPMGWLSDRFPELELVFRTGPGNWYGDPEAHQYLRA